MLSKSVQSVLRDALLEVQRRRHDLLTVEHLLYALSNSMKGRVILGHPKFPWLAAKLNSLEGKCWQRSFPCAPGVVGPDTIQGPFGCV